jgi:peptidoglycan/LPS O-acetylase OafA/YrhL
LFVIAAVGLGFHLIPLTRLQLAGSALFFRNYLAPTSESWYTIHFWSLSVEEHFYLLWPLLLALAGMRRARFLAPLLIAAVGIWRALDSRYQWIASLDPILKDNVRRTDYRLDILLCGCALALIWSQPIVQRTLHNISGSLFVIAIALAIAACLDWKPPAWLTMLAILMALFPAATVARPASFVSRVLETSGLRWIGRISYSLYIWQEVFFPGLPPTLGRTQILPWNLLAALGAATLSYYLVERPFIAWGKTQNAKRKTQKRSW